jgi:hypothetical protein
MSSARLADALLQESREDGDVEDVASVNESARSSFWELRETCDCLLCGDKGAVEIDGRVAAEVFKRNCKWVIGRRKRALADCRMLEDQFGCSRRWIVTIVDDDAGNTEGFLHFIEGVDHVFGLGEVAWDVQLVVGTVGFFHRASGNADIEACRSKLADDCLADVGACADNEGDWGFGCHCVMSDLLLVSVLRSDRVLFLIHCQ